MAHEPAPPVKRTAWAFAACIACMAIALLSPHAAYAQTTLHKEGFSNIPAQYIVFDNLDVSKATLNTSNTAFAKASVENAFGDGLKHPSIVWSIPKNGATTVTSPFSIRFPNAGYDTADGSRVDLVLSCVRLEAKLLSNRTAGASNICIIYNSAPNGVMNYEGIQLGNVTKAGESVIYAVRQTYDVRVYKTGTSTTTSRPLLCYVTDLDAPDATGTSSSYSGAFAEGINLVSGYGSDTYVSKDTMIVAENSNTRFRGSGYDEETERSAIAFTLDAAGGRIAWTGGNAGCGTALFHSYVKQITASSGTGGTMTASGTKAVIAPGKSLTENVGWRTTKTYTITPSTGYKISGIKVDGSAVAVTNSAKQTYTFSNVKANHTIAATYAPITYKIAFDGNGATSGSTASMANLKGNTAYNLTANGFKRTGYAFSGWNTAPDGTGTSYANKAQVKNLTTSDGGTVTLYAQWTPNKLTVRYYANGATYDSIAGSEVANQLLRTTTYSYDGKNLATYGVPNANRGTWCLVKPGYHATQNWLVGSGTSTRKIDADTAYPTIQDFASACGVSLASGNATVDLYAEFAPDPMPERTVVVRIPVDDYERGLDSDYGTPSFVATHASSSATIRCLVDFSDCSQSDGFCSARRTVQAPADATCTLANSTRFHVVDTQVDGSTTIFTLELSALSGPTASASAVNHVEIPNDASPVALTAQAAAVQADAIGSDNPGDDGEQEDPAPEHLLAPGSVINDAIPDGARHIAFESSPLPDGVSATDLSAQGDGSVLGYYLESEATFTITSGIEEEAIVAAADCSHMFEGCMALETIDTGNLDFSRARDLSYLFAGCRQLASVDAREWDIREAECTTGMFQACTALEQLEIGDGWGLGLAQHDPAAFPVSMHAGDATYQAGEPIPVGKAVYTASPASNAGAGGDLDLSDVQGQNPGADSTGNGEGAPSWTDDIEFPANADGALDSPDSYGSSAPYADAPDESSPSRLEEPNQMVSDDSSPAPQEGPLP